MSFVRACSCTVALLSLAEPASRPEGLRYACHACDQPAASRYACHACDQPAASRVAQAFRPASDVAQAFRPAIITASQPQTATPAGRGRGGNPAAALYAQYCASCHGPELRGGLATSLVDDEWK